MTTAANDQVVVEANGLIRACAWCCSREQLDRIQRAHRGHVTHALCIDCDRRMAQETA